MKFSYFLLFIVGLLISPLSLAQTTPAKTPVKALSSDALSAKVLLEEIIVRRFTQDLATRIPKDTFTMGAQLEVNKLEMEDIPAQEPMTDLMLGMLDPDELVRKVASEADAKETLVNFLSQYSIKQVSVSLGLIKKSIPEAKKEEIQQWLTARLKQEFGPDAKSVVNYIDELPETPTVIPEKSFLDQLKELQDFAGHAVIALALIIGSMFWGMLARARTKESVMNSKLAEAAKAQEIKDNENKERLLNIERRKNEADLLRKETAEITDRLAQLVPKTSDYFESIIRNWCNLGEAGRFRLVCFAEAVRQDLGKLPIPVDAMEDIKRVFSQMPNAQLKEKRDALEKAYWDLLAALNLGADAVAEPFSYLGDASVDTVQSILVEKNPKMRAVVALYMSDDLRTEYISSLDENSKRELLTSAAQLQSIPAQEFKTIDRQLAHQMAGNRGANEVMRLEMTLQRIIASFSPMEQIKYLREIPSENLSLYKSTTPTLAFLDEWPDDALDRLINGITTDEIVNYIQVVPAMKDKFLSLCRPMTAQMVRDELNRESALSDTEKNRLLENTLERLQILVESKIIDLRRIYPDTKPHLYVAS